jgi:hypothetical protein
MLGLLFALALVPRLYSAQNLGWDWDYPGSFTLINFDEGGSCRAALGGFSYSTFVGRQTIALATGIGLGPPADITGKHLWVKAYCHSPGHITVARVYSALLGALTVVAVAVLALQLVPGQPGVAWTAAALLALSGFHITESHSGTVDAPLVFFLYSFLAVLAWARRRHSVAGLVLSLPLALAAVWTKYWVFAFFAYLTLVPPSAWSYAVRGFTPTRLAGTILAMSVFLAALTNLEFPVWGLIPIGVVYGVFIPWRSLERPMIIAWLVLPLAAWLVVQVELIDVYTRSTEEGGFGTGYGAIGANKWLRNLVNVPAVLIVGLGLPACLFIPLGIRRLLRRDVDLQVWSCMLPLLVFLLFMAFLAPVTYYRHYLALLPVAAITAAMGLYVTRWSGRAWFMALFLLWPALLAVDLVADYHRDPRQKLRPWFAQAPEARVLTSFYVSPPPGAATRLFRLSGTGEDAAVLKTADYLILSENWYDTAFANELNGPRVERLDRLIKTRPQYASFYRDVLAGRHPLLREEVVYSVGNFMPELRVHKRLYGTFPMFVGDLRIYTILD